jgi:hypothetical protein
MSTLAEWIDEPGLSRITSTGWVKLYTRANPVWEAEMKASAGALARTQLAAARRLPRREPGAAPQIPRPASPFDGEEWF